MAELQFDDNRLSALIADAVKDMLAKEQARLGKLSDSFLGEAAKTERELLKQIEDAQDRFESRAQEKLKAAENVIDDFEKAVAEKKKKVDDMLNVKILAGFSAFLLIGSLVALSYLGDRISTVNAKVKEYTEASQHLDQSREQLETAIQNAQKVYKDATQGGDATPMQALTGYVTRIDADNQRIGVDLKKLQNEAGPVIADYAAHHKK